MPKTTTIAQLLGFTNEEYYNEYVSRYMRWLMQYCINHESELQQLMANKAICNYYDEVHGDLENQAYKILLPQDAKITVSAARRIYNAVMLDLFKAYPKPLFDAARKLTIIGNPN